MGRLYNEEEQQPLLHKTDAEPEDVDRPLSICSKLCYGLGGVPFIMTAGVIISYMSFFLLEVAMIRPAYVSVVMLGGRLVEAMVNPVIGTIVNRLDSRFGKMKPWIACSLPFVMLTFLLNWIVPDISEALKFAFYLSMYCAYLISLTFYNLPHMSLTMFLTTDQKDRDSATVYRLFCAVFGSVVGNIIVSEFLASVDAGDTGDPCVDYNHSVPINSTVIAESPLEWAFLASSGIIIGTVLVCGIIVLVGTTEKKDIYIGKSGGDGNIWKNMKSVISFRSFYIALPVGLGPMLVLQLMFSNMTLYLLYSLHIDSFYYGVIILQGSDVLYMPVWQKILSKIGKKKSLALGSVMLIPIMVLLFFLPENNVVIAFIFCHLVGAGLSCLHLLPWSLLPDVIDDYVVETEVGNDALFYSFFQCFSRITQGVGLGLATLVLGFAGYETGACQQPESVDLTMRIIVSIVPTCIILVTLIFLWIYPINESRRSENQVTLAKRRELHRSSSAMVLRKRTTQDLEI